MLLLPFVLIFEVLVLEAGIALSYEWLCLDPYLIRREFRSIVALP